MKTLFALVLLLCGCAAPVSEPESVFAPSPVVAFAQTDAIQIPRGGDVLAEMRERQQRESDRLFDMRLTEYKQKHPEASRDELSLLESRLLLFQLHSTDAFETGMTPDQVLVIMGLRPSRIVETGGVIASEQWFYNHEYNPSAHFVFINGKLSSWIVSR